MKRKKGWDDDWYWLMGGEEDQKKQKKKTCPMMDMQAELTVSSGTGNQESVDRLLRSGVYTEGICDSGGLNPLMSACRRGHKGIVNSLLRAGAIVNSWTESGGTPLINACRGGHPSIAELLLLAGARIDERDSSGNTALIEACRSGDNVDTVRFLLLHGANKDAVGMNGETPLICATNNIHPRCTAFLLRQGVDTEKRSESGMTAMDIAERCKYMLRIFGNHHRWILRHFVLGTDGRFVRKGCPVILLQGFPLIVAFILGLAMPERLRRREPILY